MPGGRGIHFLARHFYTGLAQSVEHWSPKPGVGRSSRSSRANRKVNMNRIVNYCKACYEELAHKTTWPTRAQLTHSAMVVLCASLVIAVVVFCMDSVFKFVMSSIYPN